MNPLILSIVSLIISFIAFASAAYMYYKVGILCRVNDKKDFVSMIDSYQETITQVQDVHQDLLAELKRVGGMSYNSLQKVGFLRYNPFQETGGNQSFTFCLLDAKNTGIIVSSLHGREGTRIYGKEVQKGVSVQQLSDEEKQVLDEAQNRKV